MSYEVHCLSFGKKCLKEGEMCGLSPLVSLFPAGPCRRSHSSLTVCRLFP